MKLPDMFQWDLTWEPGGAQVERARGAVGGELVKRGVVGEEVYTTNRESLASVVSRDFRTCLDGESSISTKQAQPDAEEVEDAEAEVSTLRGEDMEPYNMAHLEHRATSPTVPGQ